MNISRRGFLKGLGAAMAVGFVADPVTELLLPQPKKIWVVGAQLIRQEAKTANFGMLYGEYLPPLRVRPNYSEIARQMFAVQPMPTGAQPYYLERQWPSRS